MEHSSNLALPFIMPSQSQKHVTHNEAIRALDALVQLTVTGSDTGIPPADPAEGDRHIVGASASGAWSGHENEIAAFQDGAWAFHAPNSGWIAWDVPNSALLVWSGTEWSDAGAGFVNPAEFVGINTLADAADRLAVKADSVLLSHDDVTPGSGDMRAKVNKADAGATASILFQTAYSGRAELGLAGDDMLHIKTSPDGSSWNDTLVLDPATGFCGFGTNLPLGGVSVERTTGLLAAFVLDDASAAPGSGGAGMVSYRKPTPAAADDRLGYLLFGSKGGGAATYHPAGIQGLSEAAWTADVSHPAYLNILTTSAGSTTRTARWRWEGAGHFRPEADNAYTIGNASYRVSAVWAANGTIQTSDARDKQVVGDLGFATAMIDAVDPKLFKWLAGGNELVPSETEEVWLEDEQKSVPKMDVVARPGQRVHAGFLAQELKAAMDAAGVDFAAWGLEDKEDPDSRQWLRPDQLTAVLWAALKETRADVAALKAMMV